MSSGTGQGWVNPRFVRIAGTRMNLKRTIEATKSFKIILKNKYL